MSEYLTPWWEYMEEAQGGKTEVECWIAEPRIPGVRRHIPYRGDSKPLAVVVYKEMIGKVPRGFWVRSTCGNPDCVNPKHLGLVDQRIKSPTELRGTLLKYDEVIEIRSMYEKGVCFEDIAAKFKIGVQTCRNVCYGHTWKNIENGEFDAQFSKTIRWERLKRAAGDGGSV